MVTFGRLRFIKAVKIFDGAHFLPPEAVLVFKDRKLMEVNVSGSVPSDKIEFLDGILTPGFINAHCHLELSHLKGRLKRNTGFCDFALALMKERASDQLHVRHAAMQEAVNEMRENGIVAVGDISNSGESFAVKLANPEMYFHTFVELISLNPGSARKVFESGSALLQQLVAEGLDGSLAAHAPYSVSSRLLELIADFDQRNSLPSTVHSQESQEEGRFLMGEDSSVQKLYRSLNIDLSFYEPPLKKTVAYLEPLLKAVPTILVHNTFAAVADVELAAATNVSWCFCPGANIYIEGAQPDYSFFRDHPRRLCVGTDSLASNHKLDVVAELNRIASAAPFFHVEQLLAMITGNGAAALGISDRFGHLIPGTEAGLNLVDHDGIKFELVDQLI